MDTWRASHFFDFTGLSEAECDAVFAEFARNGAEYLTVNSELLQEMIAEDGMVDRFLKLGEKYNIRFFDIHGLCGRGYDLNTMGAEQRENMFSEHVKAFEVAAKIGAKNYVIHVGAACCADNFWLGHEDLLRQTAIENLERLLPFAEKNGVTIAVENAFEPSNTPAEVVYYMTHLSSPALGACFDAGHATMMSATSVKRDRDENEDIERKVVWHGKLEFQHNALELMAPYIVTCHLHDNNGYSDQHKLIFSGVADWNKYADGLRRCPRLRSVQDEIKSGASSIAEMCQAFDKLKTMVWSK